MKFSVINSILGEDLRNWEHITDTTDTKISHIFFSLHLTFFYVCAIKLNIYIAYCLTHEFGNLCYPQDTPRSGEQEFEDILTNGLTE